ncbi:hypothetical protein RHMOL_Rhmol01G0374700 [Rhododendron molle]|uniref:Uncharacterized protein n=1 Tax=Rhododendron molle TaxID=49168 RepID=A0ACC0QB95_RHOML|nr:hypothetical protein RHMOL_Rhmol01G0374700 [Rhododendron molle]
MDRRSAAKRGITNTASVARLQFEGVVQQLRFKSRFLWHPAIFNRSSRLDPLPPSSPTLRNHKSLLQQLSVHVLFGSWYTYISVIEIREAYARRQSPRRSEARRGEARRAPH